ncbi:MAG: ABC transporter ATP-binding protein [Dongiaceae bacterium]
MAEALVELIGLGKRYDGAVAVEGVDLSIAPGEYVVLLGPSGSGKTTILSMLGGFVPPSAGRVRIGGVDVTALPPARRPTATVFQDYALFPHMSVGANVGFGLRMRKVAKAERRRRAEDVLRLVGLEGFGARAVHNLSGGQRQRVALARAIAVAPAVLLLDEPLGALDLTLRRQMQGELVRIQKRLGTSFVHVTHDQEEAMSIADTIVLLNRGRIEDSGPPDRIYLRPASVFAATFMGESNILAGRVVAAAAGRCRVETPLGPLPAAGAGRVGDDVHLLVRPERLLLGSAADDDAVPLGRGGVVELSFQGTHLRCRVEAGGLPLLLRLAVDAPVAVGAAVELRVRPGDLVLLRD